MKQIYEAWEEADGECSAITFGRPDQLQDYRAKKLLSVKAVLLHRVEVDTYEEAMAVHYVKMGYEPYKPIGKAADCPNGCGAKFYPEGSSQCPNCGEIT